MSTDSGIYTIFSLLPYEKDSQLINKQQKLKDLYFIKSLIEIALMALEHFTKGNIIHFDAQVGDNLCQIRAYINACLVRKHLICDKTQILNECTRIQDYLNKLEDKIVEWEALISHSFSYNKILDSREPFGDFIKKNELELELQEDFIFIIGCYFLAHYCVREEGYPVSINLNFASRELHISKYKSKRLIHKLQILICDLGCKFILSAAINLPEALLCFDILPKLKRLTDDNKPVLPCFMVSEVILYRCIQDRIPILFIIKRFNSITDECIDIIYFRFIGNGQIDLEIAANDSLVDEYCISIVGCLHTESVDIGSDLLQLINSVLKITPQKLILANMASHPQYSDHRLAAFRDNPFLSIDEEKNDRISTHLNKLVKMRTFAINHGCTMENPTQFFLKHIYASKMSAELTNLNKTHANRIYDASKYYFQNR
jgi:hypothetical protein